MKLFCCVFALAFSSTTIAQNSPQEKLDSFSAKFVTAIRTHEQQRVFMATDKSIYTNGESIWFRAFLINTISDKINSDSKFLFADLVDDKDHVIKTVILDAANKQTDSKITLPKSLPSGNYWLRAYTRQILKTDPLNMCVKPIYVINLSDESPLKSQLNKTSSPAADSVVVSFYPEGGNLITGADCIVAVRTTDINGNPISVKGLIRDNYDAVMAGFTTDEYGLGKFDFEPSGHREYRAIIKNNGKESNYPLPPFNFYKGQISVTRSSPNYMVRVLLGDSIYTKNTLSYLIAISKDKMAFASIGSGIYQVAVPEKKLPDGIVTFYLFDADFKLLSERSVYVDDSSLVVKVNTDKNVYSRHEKATLDLSMTEKDGNAVPSLVAISVFDSAFSDPIQMCPVLPADYANETIDNIFLASDECLTDKEKDVLMIIRKNSYEKLSQTVENDKYIDNDSLLYLKGVVLDKNNESSASKVITLISNSSNLGFRNDTTDIKGRFRFAVDNYADSTPFVLQVKNLKGKVENSEIILDTTVYPKVKTPPPLKEKLELEPRKIKTHLDRYYVVDTTDKHVLPHVYLKDQNYDVTKRVSTISAILSSKQLNERSSVGDAVLTVGGLHRLNGFLVINGLTDMNVPSYRSEPMVLVDGVPVNTQPFQDDPRETSPDLSYLNSLDPKHIDFIEILKGSDGARYGLRGGNGVILVNTLNVPRDLASKNNMKTYYATGISKPVFFPITAYQENDEKAETSDDRPTLFWSGNYFTDKPKNTITFYTSGVPGTYWVTLTGITSRGDLIFKKITFETK